MGKNRGPPHRIIDGDDDYILMREYYAYKLMIRLSEVEQYHLEWIKRNQKTIRSDLYNSIRDSLRKGDSDTKCQGKNVILPATFSGSRRYISQYFKDSLAICHSIGHPSFFLTMTCNTKWPEIQSMLQHISGVNVADASDVRLLGYDIHYRYPSVERLPIHVEGGKNITFNVNDSLEEVVNKASNRKSKLKAWFVANKIIPDAWDYTYQEFPRGFTWLPGQSKWKKYERGIIIRRLTEVHASQADTFFLRMLLLRNKCATSFHDLRTINGRTYTTYKEACEVLVADPLKLWSDNWKFLSEDILYNKWKKSSNMELSLSDADLENFTLAEVEKLLNGICKSLKEFSNMKYPEDIYLHSMTNCLIEEEIRYDKNQQFEEHSKIYQSLNSDQLEVYNSSNLWNYCKVFVLHHNMRLGCGRNAKENKNIAEFSKWVLDVGDDKVQNIHLDNIYIDPEIIIPKKYFVEKKTNAVKDIVEVTYPDFSKNYINELYLKERAILTPRNAIVDEDTLNQSENMFHQLSALNTSSTAWRLNNRITRMWPSQSSNEMLKGYNLILLDAHDTHVPAFEDTND
ncbi:uncharacterized protein LOC141696335 [Apium graveolens]|uniref:uncharacterized protein LOC141696335 n=1 Tax=Apium graveolens TaxID=4045 RepID=UPI003D7AFDE6